MYKPHLESQYKKQFLRFNIDLSESPHLDNEIDDQIQDDTAFIGRHEIKRKANK